MIKKMKEGLAAWKRGEERVAPYPARGRVFKKKNGEESSATAIHAAKALAAGKLKLRVYRAATGEWEDLTPPKPWYKRLLEKLING